MKKSELAAVAANGYWREPEARIVLAAWRASGKTLNEFAAAEGLSGEKLTRWRRRLEGDGDRRGGSATRAAATFAPVEVIQVGAVVRVEAHGVAIEVVGATPAWVAALARELGRSA
jgi:hypothetical protein